MTDALTKTQYLDGTVLAPDGATDHLIPADELARRGLAAAPLQKRATLVAASVLAQNANPAFPQNDQGVPDFAFPGD